MARKKKAVKAVKVAKRSRKATAPAVPVKYGLAPVMLTDAELEAIYRANSGSSQGGAMRAVWNAGWYAGAGVKPRPK